MPKETKVHKCVQSCKTKKKSKKTNCYAICQAQTGQSYATGKKLTAKKSSTKKKASKRGKRR